MSKRKVLDEAANDKVEILIQACADIFNKNISKFSFEELCMNVYNLITKRYGDLLYQKLHDYIISHLKILLSHIMIPEDETTFLFEFINIWNDYHKALLSIRDVMLYMDNVFISKDPTRLDVLNLGIHLYIETIVNSYDFKKKIFHGIMNMIIKERETEPINKELLKSIIHILVIELGREVYDSVFEIPFLEQSEIFYQEEANRLFSELNCNEYLKVVETWINAEAARVKDYLDDATDIKIRKVVETQMLSKYLKPLVEMEGSGIISMLTGEKFQELNLMYTLLKNVNGGHELMKEHLLEYIINLGTDVLKVPMEQKNAITFISELIVLKKKYDILLFEAFEEDRDFRIVVNKAFKHIINLDPRAPEYLSLFLDSKLRKTQKALNDIELENTLNDGIFLFRLLANKDVFERYYKTHFASRLLNQRSLSEDAEDMMIGKLKAECGYAYTSKLTNMLKDINISSEISKKFADAPDLKDKVHGIDFGVNVLSTSAWQTQPIKECQFPSEMAEYCESFKDFYLSSHPGRKLTWDPSMGTAELVITFSGSGEKHELIVSTQQMSILLLFNERLMWTGADLVIATGLTWTLLYKSLYPLTLAKHQILSVHPATGELTEKSEFQINENFTNKMYKVKVGQLVSKGDTNAQVIESKTKINEERKYQIEAAIVRIMKTRQTMAHSNLVAEVISDLSKRFNPDVTQIKLKIENLIDREFLERDPNDSQKYNYLA